MAQVTEEQRCSLHSIESSFVYRTLPPVSSASFFHCENAAKLQEFVDVVRGRIKETVRANPWISGHLEPNGGKLELVYDSETVKSDFLSLRKADREKIDPHCNFEELYAFCQPIPVKPTKECIEKGMHLFAVEVIVPHDVNNDSEKELDVCLILSLSHVIADGYTYYRIFEMCTNVNAPIVSLDPARPEAFAKHGAEAMGGMSRYDLKWSFKFLASSAIVALTTKAPSTATVRIIDPAFIQREKDKAQAENQGNSNFFVSTNDVLVTWWAKQVEASFVAIAVNMRNRISSAEVVNQKSAGNYLCNPLLYGDTLSSPSRMRKVIATDPLNKYAPHPTVLAALRGKHAFVTNWMSLTPKEDPCLPPAEFLRHVPVVNPDDLPPTMGMGLLIIFRPRMGQTAIVYAVRDPRIEKRCLESGAFLDESV